MEILYVGTVLIGMFVSCAVAATGIGGGLLLVPLLVLALHVPPVVAGGSSLLFMALTKLWAVLLHWKQHTVDYRLAFGLSTGSIPGALIGSGVLWALKGRLAEGFNHLLAVITALSIIMIAALSLGMEFLRTRSAWLSPPHTGKTFGHPLWIGFLGG